VAWASVIVALPVRPVAFVAVAVALAGSGRVLLAGLPRRAVVVVSRRAVVPVPLAGALVVVAFMARRGVLVVLRVTRRYVVPVTDGAPAGRGVMRLAGLSGWGVVPVSDGTPAGRCVSVAVVSLALIVISAHRRRRLSGRRRRGRWSRGRRSGRSRRGGSAASARGRWLVMTPGLRGRMRGTTDRVRLRMALCRGRDPDGGRRSRRTLRCDRPVACVGGERRRRHHDLCGRRRRRTGTGTAAPDPDRPEMWREESVAGREDQGHRGAAEHERDKRRRRYASKFPDCAPFAAFVGRQRPSFPFPHGLPRP
jgi:hypothetical protein